MCSCFHCRCREEVSLLVVWIIVIVIVGVIGALSRSPPETTHHSFNYDYSKLQHITIGGESRTNIGTT